MKLSRKRKAELYDEGQVDSNDDAEHLKKALEMVVIYSRRNGIAYDIAAKALFEQEQRQIKRGTGK